MLELRCIIRQLIGIYSNGELSSFNDAHTAKIIGHKRLTVLADGYISNVNEIITANQNTGQPPSNIAQQIGQAYLRWGINLSKHTLGQFAAAIVDHGNGQVTLVQDSLGIRQIFYASIAGKFYFASRLDDIAMILKDVELDMEYFADILAKAVVSTERTPYKNIRRLRFGMALVWRADRCVLSSAWSPVDAQAPPVKNEPEYEELLRERLFGAVEPLVGCGEIVWCHLSGGLDSTSVLLSALLLGKKVSALTFIDPSGADFGDTKVSREVIDALDIPWHTINVQSYLPFSCLPATHYGEPGAETHINRQDACFKLLHHHGVNAVLTGIGGDVAFGSPDWPSYQLADALYRLDYSSLFKSLAQSLNQDLQRRSWIHWLVNGAVKPTFRHLLRQRIGRGGEFVVLPSWLDQRFVRVHDLRSKYLFQETPRHPEPGRHALWEEAYLQATDLSSVYGSRTLVDYRHPLLDRHLLEFMFSIPYEQRQRATQDRYLQRRALHKLLPKAVANRRNKGSGQRNYDEGLRTSREWLSMLTEDPWLVRLGFVDAQRWRIEVDRASFGLYESLPHFAMAACIECWLRFRYMGFPDAAAIKWENHS